MSRKTTREDALARRWSRSPRVVGRRIGSEYVLVPLAGRGADLDSIFNLNTVAAFVWEQLDGARDGSAVVDAVVARFEVSREQAAADYADLVDTLVELAAIVPAGAGRE